MKRRRKKIEMWEIANIPDEIRFDAFYYQGSEFSRVYIFDGKITAYKEKFFGGYKSPKVTDQTEAILQKMKATLPAGAVIKYKKTETKKNHETKRDLYSLNPFTPEENYLVEIEPIEVTVTIPKDVSRKLFLARPYVQDGFAFRDYLLKNRRDKLEAILKDEEYSTRWESGFCVTNWGIAWDAYDGVIGLRFDKYGLANLSSSSQQYGLALALLEVQGRKQSEITIEERSGGFEVRKRYIEPPEPPKPVVEPW